MILWHGLFPAAFPLLAISHFMALLSPGPDFFLLTGYAMRYRVSGSIGIVAGIGTGNALYILLAIAGWSELHERPELFSLIELVGAIYLLWIGSRLCRSQPNGVGLNPVTVKRPTLTAQYLLGLASSLLNPKNALFYLALMTTLLGSDVTLLQQSLCGIWMVCVVFIWNFLIVSSIGLPRIQFYLKQRIYLFERVAGGILICFSGTILWKFFTQQ
ncbi:LysE family translocator [Citrobacter sp. JGM124]|uniref:LysE family translocator n=1 Tax=Citrobacter sp. JGM124 TaxID=2799789 RepID=UPI001BAA9884|nr:LysE family translocator [Citrobacter sp. JGM124]MBS0848325.1 LysE family translocator [Citrobacter sp. JGM124]